MPGAMPSIDYRVFGSGMGCSSRERKTKHNNPAMDSRFPIQALELLDKTTISSTGYRQLRVGSQ
jgi:hypothetical protein